ncbi:MAG: hypothetical protein Kow00133_18270 [Amphiplicatus sp.]
MSATLAAFQVVLQHVILPLLFIFWMTAGRYAALFKPRLRLIAYILYTDFAAFFLFILVCGAWGIVGYWLRPLLAVAFALASVDYFRRIDAVPREKARITTLLSGGFYALMALVFGGFGLLGLAGRIAPAETIDLAFPLNDGIYVVGQGGASVAVNYHNAHPAQAYALDILKLNSAGFRAAGVFPKEPDRYAIFGDMATSPCAGRIAWARDGLDDARGMQNDRESPAGNAVAVECGGVTVYLAHLMKGSLAVAAGDMVRVGDPIGRVGNSGNTTEPHLHIHAQRGPFQGEFSTAPAVAIRFDGRFLARGDLVFARAAAEAEE